MMRFAMLALMLAVAACDEEPLGPQPTKPVEHLPALPEASGPPAAVAPAPPTLDREVVPPGRPMPQLIKGTPADVAPSSPTASAPHSKASPAPAPAKKKKHHK